MEIEKSIFDFMKKQNPNLVFSVELNEVGQVQSMDYENLDSAMGFFNRMILNDREPKSDAETKAKTTGFKTADRFIKSLTSEQVDLFLSVFSNVDSDGDSLFTSLVLSPTNQKWSSKENKFVEQNGTSIATYKDKNDAKIAASEDKDSKETNRYEYYNSITKLKMNNVLTSRHSKIESEFSKYTSFLKSQNKK
jgi:hypothetical protein